MTSITLEFYCVCLPAGLWGEMHQSSIFVSPYPAQDQRKVDFQTQVCLEWVRKQMNG